MPDQTEQVTVFRSADETAEEDARAIGEMMAASGISAAVLDDSAPEVPTGAWEVRVPSGQAAEAERLIAQAPLPEDELTEVDTSADLDMETVFRAAAGTTQELEASAVASLLEGAGIATIMVGDSVLPNLGFEVRVAKEHAERARELLREAQASGPAAADEAERATEKN